MEKVIQLCNYVCIHGYRFSNHMTCLAKHKATLEDSKSSRPGIPFAYEC